MYDNNLYKVILLNSLWKFKGVWFRWHGLFRKCRSWNNIIIQIPQLWLLEWGCKGLKNFPKGLRDVKVKKEELVLDNGSPNVGTEHEEINTGAQTKRQSDLWQSEGPFSVVLFIYLFIYLFLSYLLVPFFFFFFFLSTFPTLVSRSRSFAHHTPVIIYVLFHDAGFPGRLIFLESNARLLCKCKRSW